MASGTARVDLSSGLAENGRTDEPASSARRPPRVGDYLGKHRLSAAIGRLHQEIQSLESELEELDKMEPSSAACNETSNFSQVSLTVPSVDNSVFSLPWKEYQMLFFPSPKGLRILLGRDGFSQYEAPGTANGGATENLMFLKCCNSDLFNKKL